MIYLDDCLNVLKTILCDTIDMIYLDPPFFTQKNQSMFNLKGEKYEFQDTWASKTDYIEFIKIRLIEMKRVLKNTGSIFFHCDSNASHFLRILLDEVFGENNFRSEIIWSYKKWSNSKKGLLQNHQTIFFYSKSRNYKFNTIYGDYSPTTNLDQILQMRIRNSLGKASYKYDENGELEISNEKKGVPLSDVWEIPFLNPKAKERVGYPTQKPIELLDRIIKIATDVGDTVLDPFCGSGTTLVSAKMLKRNFIGIDANPKAIELTNKRLKNPYKTKSNLLEIGKSAYMTKTQSELMILNQFDCDIVQRNKGIDALLKKKFNNGFVAIKIQKKNESFLDAVELLDNAGKKKNCSLTVLITYQSNWENFIIPKNMIILASYQIQLEKILENNLTKISRNPIFVVPNKNENNNGDKVADGTMTQFAEIGKYKCTYPC